MIIVPCPCIEATDFKSISINAQDSAAVRTGEAYLRYSGAYKECSKAAPSAHSSLDC